MSRPVRTFAFLFVLIFIASSLGACSSGVSSTALKDKKIGIFANEFSFDVTEFDKFVKELKDAGAKVIVTSTTKREFTAEQFIYIDDMKAGDVDAIIFLSGYGNSKYLGNKGIQAFIKQFSDAGKVIGAIGDGNWLLADAGIIKGKKVTGLPESKSLVEKSGAVFTGSAVEVDGNFVTCDDKKQTELIKKLAEVLASQNK